MASCSLLWLSAFGKPSGGGALGPRGCARRKGSLPNAWGVGAFHPWTWGRLVDWESGRRSDNVEDRRGMGRPVAVGGGLTILVLLVGWLFGVDPSQLLQLLGNTDTTSQGAGTATSNAPVKGTPAEERQKDFVSVVLASTEDTWKPLFAARGMTYPPPKLVLFRDGVQSACGFTESASEVSRVTGQ